MLHIWSDIPNHKALWVIPKPSMVHSAHEHTKKGDSYKGAASLKQLEEIFASYKKQNKKIDKLDFHTHGGPGKLAIGSERLGFETLKNFRDKGFDQIFTPEARVFFHGCNVAENAAGELFLAEFGQIFLKTGGGRVGGSTSVGMTDVIFNTGKTIHFWGDTVYAYVLPGGKATLKNHRHLDSRHIEGQIVVGNTKVIPVLAPLCGGYQQQWRRPLLDEAKTNLAKATAFLASSKTAKHPYRYLHDAHLYLDRAVKPLQRIVGSLSMTEQVYIQVKEWIK